MRRFATPSSGVTSRRARPVCEALAGCDLEAIARILLVYDQRVTDGLALVVGNADAWLRPSLRPSALAGRGRVAGAKLAIIQCVCISQHVISTRDIQRLITGTAATLLHSGGTIVDLRRLGGEPSVPAETCDATSRSRTNSRPCGVGTTSGRLPSTGSASHSARGTALLDFGLDCIAPTASTNCQRARRFDRDTARLIEVADDQILGLIGPRWCRATTSASVSSEVRHGR